MTIERIGVRAMGAMLLCLLAAAASAEIQKLAAPGGRGIAIRWWPKVEPPEKWHRDHEQSIDNGLNALAPDGFTFVSADTVMYAMAIYKPQQPDVKSVDMLIEKDKRKFLKRDAGLGVREAPALTTADGQRLKSFVFQPKGKGN